MNEIRLASIPEGGEDGQVLQLSNGKFEWVSLEPTQLTIEEISEIRAILPKLRRLLSSGADD